jgi:allantoinase
MCSPTAGVTTGIASPSGGCRLLPRDEPFPIKVRSGRLISIPYSIELNDAVVVAYQQQTAESFARMIKDQFDQLYQEGETSGRVMCIATHPYLMDSPSRQKYLRDALEYVYGHSGVWNTTGSEIADWYYGSCYDDVATRSRAHE